MKAFKYILAAASLLVIFSSCQKTEAEKCDGPKYMEFTAGSDNATKVSLAQDKTTVIWDANDSIGVFDNTKLNKFKITSGEGSAYGTFSGTAGEGQTYLKKYFALYPYIEDAKLNTTSIGNMTIPFSQQAISGNIAKRSMVMYAETTNQDKDFQFKHVCAYLKITAPSNGTKLVIKSNNTNLCVVGVVTVQLNGSYPGWTAQQISTSTEVGNDIVGGQNYYVAVLPQVYDQGLTITEVFSNLTEKSYKLTTSMTLERGKVYPVTLTSGN